MIEQVLHEAGVRRWCTKPVCTTCGATQFREALCSSGLTSPLAMMKALEGMELSAWYDVDYPGGALNLAFKHLSNVQQVDRVLANWRMRIAGHVCVIDSVVFHIVRRGLSSPAEAEAWLSLARAEALASRDPSLLETLVYALGRNITSDTALFDVAKVKRRGYSPLQRALNRMVGHLVAEA